VLAKVLKLILGRASIITWLQYVLDDGKNGKENTKQRRTRELRIHIVFTCSVMSKIEFSWENSTYVLGKIN